MNKYRKIDDPGHGWLEVPLKEVLDSGADISYFSYFNGGNNMVYLEEDLDMFNFLKASKGITKKSVVPEGESKWEYNVQIEEVHQENTFVRGLPSFDLSKYKK